MSKDVLSWQIQTSIDAIERQDLQAYKAVIDKLEANLPCFDFVPQPEAWADLLVGMAIVSFAEHGDWQGPLATALHIDPRVDLRVGPSHPIRSWVLPIQPTLSGTPVPEGVRLFVDGELVSEVPAASGLHLVQRRTGDGLDTLLLHDQPVPEAWLQSPPLLQRLDLGWGQLTVGLGGQLQSQSPELGGSYLLSRRQLSLDLGAALDGLLPLSQRLGLRYQLAANDLITGSLSFGLGLGLRAGPWALALGGAARGLPVVNAEGAASIWLPLPVASLDHQGSRGTVGLSLGASPAVFQSVARASHRLRDGRLSPVLGARLWFTRAWLAQAGTTRAASITESGLLLQVGLDWRAPT